MRPGSVRILWEAGESGENSFRSEQDRRSLNSLVLDLLSPDTFHPLVIVIRILRSPSLSFE